MSATERKDNEPRGPGSSMSGGRIEGRAAVVTGGAGGIGLETARRLLHEGASVLIGDYNAGAGQAAAAQLEAEGFGGRVRFRRVDVSVESDVEALMGEAVETFGRLDIVFN